LIIYFCLAFSYSNERSKIKIKIENEKMMKKKKRVSLFLFDLIAKYKIIKIKESNFDLKQTNRPKTSTQNSFY